MFMPSYPILSILPYLYKNIFSQMYNFQQAYCGREKYVIKGFGRFSDPWSLVLSQLLSAYNIGHVDTESDALVYQDVGLTYKIAKNAVSIF